MILKFRILLINVDNVPLTQVLVAATQWYAERQPCLQLSRLLPPLVGWPSILTLEIGLEGLLCPAKLPGVLEFVCKRWY